MTFQLQLYDFTFFFVLNVDFFFLVSSNLDPLEDFFVLLSVPSLAWWYGVDNKGLH